MRFTVNLSDKYATGEASQDNCEAYLSFCESNYTLPRTTFTMNNIDFEYDFGREKVWPKKAENLASGKPAMQR
jgi:hypothetical protein